MLCEFYLAEVVSRTRAPDPAARAPFAAEAADALEAFLRRCEVHDLLTPEAKRQREELKRQRERGQNADPGTARADKVARFRRERAIRARLEELESTRRRRAEEALLNADWDDEDPDDASPEDEVEERERWTLLIEDAVAKSLDNVAHLARELEMIAARDELAAAVSAGPRAAGGVDAPGRGVTALMPDGAVVPGFNASSGCASSTGVNRRVDRRRRFRGADESLRRMYGTGVAGVRRGARGGSGRVLTVASSR